MTKITMPESTYPGYEIFTDPSGTSMYRHLETGSTGPTSSLEAAAWLAQRSAPVTGLIPDNYLSDGAFSGTPQDAVNLRNELLQGDEASGLASLRGYVTQIGNNSQEKQMLINKYGPAVWDMLVQAQNYDARKSVSDRHNSLGFKIADSLHTVVPAAIAAGTITGLTTGSGALAGGSGATSSGGALAPGAGVTAPASSYLPGGTAAWSPTALSSQYGAGSGVIAAGSAGAATSGLAPASLPASAVINGASGTAINAAANSLGGAMPSSWPSWLTPAIQTGATLLGGVLANDAAGDAIDAQVAAGDRSLDYLRESRDLALELSAPYREASLGALDEMQRMTQPGYDVATDPGYQFRMEEGMNALEKSAAAKGSLESGGFARQALRYAQGLASQEYSKIYDRLSVIAGYSPLGSDTNAALNYGSNAGNVAINTGEAQGYGALFRGNAWQNAMDQLMQIDWG